MPCRKAVYSARWQMQSSTAGEGKPQADKGKGLRSKVPSKLCACVRAYKPWDEHTQENLERTLMFLPKNVCAYFIHVVANANESW